MKNRILSQHLELYRSLSQAVAQMRWATLAVLLLLTLVEPNSGRVDIPSWALLLLFALYNLGVALLPHSSTVRRSHIQNFVFDLPVAALAYFLGNAPGSPLFVLIVLSVTCAAVSMSLLSSLLYTGAAMILTAAIEPTLPLWTSTPEAIREVGTRLVILALAGTGTAILARRFTLEQEIAREQAASLQERERMRDNYISTVSHGLRTPFTAVRAGLGMIETSLADRLRPEEAMLFTQVQENADRVFMRINDLLALNQLEAGALHLDRKPLDLRDVITDAIAMMHPLIVGKGQTLEVDLPGPLQMRGDARRLEQVVVNLLDNAHQHTPAGTRIIVSGRSESSERGAPGELLLIVRDTGPGIPHEEHELIFQQFHSADHDAGGWGIGLAVASAVVELHGGRIWVESSVGAGATFFVGLPCHGEEASEQC